MIQIIDGAMGTMLQSAGLRAGDCPEHFNLKQPDTVRQIHAEYVRSGATILETNSFGANRLKLSHYGLSDSVREINLAAARIARAAAGEAAKVAGSVGPLGKFLQPLGEVSFDEACAVYAEQIAALEEGGVDYIVIETMIDIQEMRAALIAAKSASTKPVICQMSYSENGRTVTGTDPRTAAVTLEALGASVIGANCSLGPEQLLPIVEQLAAATDLPISVQPNAGMPQLSGGQTVFPMRPEALAVWGPKLVAAGASYIGGCCGTTPAHIAALSAAVATLSPAPRPQAKRLFALSSRSKTVYIDASLPPILIGERINPTGRKQLAAEIRAGNFISVKREALEQTEAGAQVLDVNMGVPGIDQAAAMQKAVLEISQLVDAPLSLDTGDAATLEAALKAYPGRALINSVSAEPERLAQFLPLAKKYGAAILCLPLSEKGLPKTAAERVAVLETIFDRARAAGLSERDCMLDALVMTIASDARACREVLDALRLYRTRFGCPATMGLSNISFGLPNRPLMNATFFTLCLACGLDAPILNPYDSAMQDAFSAALALLGHDRSGHAYTLRNTASPLPPESEEAAQSIERRIQNAVLRGEKESVSALVETALQEGYSALEITDRCLTPGMEKVGDLFGQNKMFLPQVLLSAETMHSAFETLKRLLPAQAFKSKGTFVIATVKGDIHDLGKNIVAALLENNGWRVVDLGKDVDSETIVREAIATEADFVGLCALMTTTMPQIDIAVAQLKAAGCPAKIMVGGAVLTPEYAAEAGADAYARDGIDAVKQASQLAKQNA